jgi:uncharacterized membrane protein YeiB
VIGLVLGLPINVALVLCQLKLADPESATPAIAIVSQVLYPFACLLTPLYVVLVVWLNRTAKRAAIGGWILWVLACMGRVALTNYLLQSVGMLLLLSSLGLGLADRLSLEDLALIGFATCLTQAGSAVLLLRWFRMGPAEWIWRRYVYAGAAVPLQPKN